MFRQTLQFPSVADHVWKFFRAGSGYMMMMFGEAEERAAI
jgi:hypothetical protein